MCLDVVVDISNRLCKKNRFSHFGAYIFPSFFSLFVSRLRQQSDEHTQTHVRRARCIAVCFSFCLSLSSPRLFFLSLDFSLLPPWMMLSNACAVCASHYNRYIGVGKRTPFSSFTYLSIYFFSRAVRNQRNRFTAEAETEKREKERCECDSVEKNYIHKCVFFCLDFGGHTLALVHILLSFSNDDDRRMVWCSMYLPRDSHLFHLKRNYVLSFSHCGFSQHGIVHAVLVSEWKCEKCEPLVGQITIFGFTSENHTKITIQNWKRRLGKL